MSIDGLDHVSDITVRLSDVTDASMLPADAFDERQEVVIERQQEPVAFEGVLEMIPVRISECVLAAGRMDRPASPTQSISDRNPDPLVTVHRPHAGADSAGRNSWI